MEQNKENKQQEFVSINGVVSAEVPDPGLSALAMIAGYYRIGAEPAQLRHQLALFDRASGPDDIMRAARLIGLKSREVSHVDAKGTVRGKSACRARGRQLAGRDE